MSRYDNFDEITPFIVNEFIDRIEVHERARKGSAQTTQKVDIYFNFIGNYSRNSYKFKPSDRTTTFGTLDDIKEFKVYFDGYKPPQWHLLEADEMEALEQYRQSRTTK